MIKATNLVPLVATEVTALKSLATIVGLRMLGLFMLLPVLALYAEQFTGATPTLIGLAIGIYGLTQAGLQIPFGMVSDKIGRKKVIIFGLLIFACGSILAAVAETIATLIIARALQGAGAISAVSMALLADLTREEVRVRAMAALGITIGFAFMLAIILGPLLSSMLGVAGIFWLTTLLAILAIFIVVFKVPNPVVSKIHADVQTMPKQFINIIKSPQLLRLNLGIFSLHLILMAVFIAIPNILVNTVKLDVDLHGILYLVVMVIAVIFMLPLVMAAEAKNQMKLIFIGAILLLLLSQLGFYFLANNLLWMTVILVIFFTAFNLLESVLPSLVSKSAPLNAKGTAMGVYSSSQFLGTFVGGIGGGWLIEHYNNYAIIFVMTTIVLLIWLVAAFGMKSKNSLGTMLLKVGIMEKSVADELAKKILKIMGVRQVLISSHDGIAFIRIDNHTINRAAVLAFSQNKLKI